MTTHAVIDALQRQKQQLEEHLPELLARCENAAERIVLTGAYTRATQQWNEACNRDLRTNNPLIDKLGAELKTLQEDIVGMIARADDLSAILNKITKGIMIGSKILTLAR